jgi:signal transduction histidine kinase
MIELEKDTKMKSPLVILLLEDDPADAALVKAKLEEEGIACSIKHVANAADFALAYQDGNLDLVLSDMSLPGFDGMTALEFTRQRFPDLPFIMLARTADEDVAIEWLKSGATDYVFMERLSRLAPVVRRAMKEAEGRLERQSLEAQFIEAQKMEVIGHLAGGVAHDFNNVVGIILGYSYLITEKLQPGDSVRDDVEMIRQAALQAAALTRQLLTFSRKQSMEPAVLDLNQVLTDHDRMLRRLINEKIALFVETASKSGRVKADSGSVGQVLMNLVVNARDAMLNGGTLRIKTQDVILGADDVRTFPNVVPGAYVLLAVSDNGTGMTDEVKARLFEPLFTTKPTGEGTGLGLATCQTIVKHFGGHIRVESQIGKGTTFEIYFPRIDQPFDKPARTTPSVPLPKGSETLLLVEDESSVRDLACKVLEVQGYRVLSASNGQEGLRMVREFNGQPIAMVITDLVMPQMGGKAMAHRLRAADPQLKVLFTSGYTDETILADAVLEPGMAFLPKPYSPADLALKVREVLDKQKSNRGGGAN